MIYKGCTSNGISIYEENCLLFVMNWKGDRAWFNNYMAVETAIAVGAIFIDSMGNVHFDF